MENVVTAIFDVESEAYQAFSEISKVPFGTDYFVAEAALLKREGDAIVVADAFDAAGVTADDTAVGMIVGSFAGILGGPLGVLLGASTGALIGTVYDTADTVGSLSLLEATALKLYDGDVAIIAFVEEEEPAFDVAFEKYATTIIRHFAVDVMDEVEQALILEADLANQARAQLRAERKAELKEAHDERVDVLKGRLAEAKERAQARREAVLDAAEETNQRMMDTQIG